MLVSAEALAAAMAAAFRDGAGHLWQLVLVDAEGAVAHPGPETYLEIATALLAEAGGPDREFDI